MKKALIAMLLLVFAAGCTGISGVFGGDILNIKQNIIQEGQKDIAVIKDPATIPKSPMLPDQSFVFSFLLENVDKTGSAENAVVELFNAPTIKSDSDGKLCNTGAGSICKPDKCSRESAAENIERSLEGVENFYSFHGELFGQLLSRRDKGCLILPGEQVPINFFLRTPTENEIVGIETKPTLDYSMTYDFESTSLYIMPSVNMEEVIKNQRGGDKLSVEVTKSYGSGPVRIDMELFGTKYILSGQSATLIFKITNTGRGNVQKSEIDPQNFIVKIPTEMLSGRSSIILPDGNEYTPGTPSRSARFDCKVAGTHILCGNIKPIEMYNDQNRGSLRFEIKKVREISQPFISYDIRAAVKYMYEIRGTQEITVKPFES